MPHLAPPDPLDLIPDPSEIHRRLADAARAQRLLRRLLRLAVAARRERASAKAAARIASPMKDEVARV